MIIVPSATWSFVDFIEGAASFYRGEPVSAYGWVGGYKRDGYLFAERMAVLSKCYEARRAATH